MEEEIFRFFHVRQRFQGEHTFRDLNLSIKKGEIHCIAGLSAVEREYFLRLFLDGFGKTGGSIFYKGSELSYENPGHNKIYCLNSGSTLIQELSIANNLFVTNSHPHPFVLSQTLINSECYLLLRSYGIDLLPTAPVNKLTYCECCMIELMRAVISDSEEIILNLEIGHIADSDFEHLCHVIRLLSTSGRTIVVLTGTLSRMLQLGTTISVIKRGRTIKTFSCTAISQKDLLNCLLDDVTEEVPYLPGANNNQVILSIQKMYLGQNDTSLDLKLYQGEIVGLIDFSYSASELILDTLFGLKPHCEELFEICQKKVKVNTPYEAFQAGIYYAQDLEHDTALFLNQTTNTNIYFPIIRQSSYTGGFLRHKYLLQEVQRISKQLDISEENLLKFPRQNNVFKINLARILIADKRILLMKNPFSGLSPQEIPIMRNFMLHYVKKGNCILFSSPHMSEIHNLCHRYYNVSGLYDTVQNS